MFSQLYMQTILCGKNDSTNLKKKKKKEPKYPFKLREITELSNFSLKAT